MIARCIIVAALLATPAGAQFREDGEAARQAKLPASGSNLWSVLRTTVVKVDDRAGRFTASHPAPVRALAGQTLTITGFMLPLEPAAKVSHFLLSKYTPVCAFCPPGEPNEVVEVNTARPIAVDTKMISVTGVFALQNNGDNGLFFKLSGASIGVAQRKAAS